MASERDRITEQIQAMVAALVATQLSGAGLCLIGGFRYRRLDQGPRRSMDIDYHWTGDLGAKQRELIALFERRLLPDVRRQCSLDGSVSAGDMRDGSDAVAVVELAFWRLGSPIGRIEIPVDVTRIDLIDHPVARTADGVVYRTASDADMLESKVIAIIGRPFVEHRDILDLYLFRSHIAADARARIAVKLSRLGIDEHPVKRRLDDLVQSAAHHARSIDAVIREQVDDAQASVLAETGGGKAVLESVCRHLRDLLGVPGTAEP